MAQQHHPPLFNCFLTLSQTPTTKSGPQAATSPRHPAIPPPAYPMDRRRDRPRDRHERRGLARLWRHALPGPRGLPRHAGRACCCGRKTSSRATLSWTCRLVFRGCRARLGTGEGGWVLWLLASYFPSRLWILVVMGVVGNGNRCARWRNGQFEEIDPLLIYPQSDLAVGKGTSVVESPRSIYFLIERYRVSSI